MKIIGTFVATFMAGCAAVGGVWSADRNPASETIEVKVVPPSVRPGDAAEVRYVYQRFRLCPRRTSASVIDSTGREFVLGVQNSPPTMYRVEGKMDTFARPFRIPLASQPGPAVYHVLISDFCNPLHYIWPVTRTIDVPFEISPPEPARSSMTPSGRFKAAVMRILALR